MKRLQAWYAGLADRERRLMQILLGVLGAFAVLLLPYGASALVSSRRDANRELQDAIQLMRDARSRLDQGKAKKDALERRYAKKAPPLAGFIEDAARQNGLEIPESRDGAPKPFGKTHMERSTVVQLRKVAMLPLVKMLEKIETSEYPVVISRLNIRTRGREPDSYDVELGVSTFDALKSAASSTPSPAASHEEKP